MQRNTNIREVLSSLEGQRKEFKAKYEKTSVNPRFPDRKTILLLDVMMKNEDGEYEIVCDHCWISKSKRWNSKENLLNVGITISFTAEVEKYYKEGIREYFHDYTLGSIRSIDIN